MDRAVDSGEGQPGPELGPGSSCGVHSWIEGASTGGWRVSWFAPQNQGGGRRLKTPSRGGTPLQVSEHEANAKAVNALFAGVSRAEFSRVQGFEKAHKIWTCLENYH